MHLFRIGIEAESRNMRVMAFTPKHGAVFVCVGLELHLAAMKGIMRIRKPGKENLILTINGLRAHFMRFVVRYRRFDFHPTCIAPVVSDGIGQHSIHRVKQQLISRF